MYEQEIVRWRDDQEKQFLIVRLEELGFQNRCHKQPAPNAIRAFCVDFKKKSFSGTNATCAAARAQAGLKTLSIEEFEERIRKEN